jgi:iron complex outermembrane receptor protein
MTNGKDMRRPHTVRAALLISAIGSTIISAPALAQVRPAETAPQPPTPTPSPAPVVGAEPAPDEIIVTARKRNETSVAVPVVITAVTGAEIERRAINNLDGIARVVPGLIIGEGGSAVQGGNVAIRGLGGADTNILGDQAVSFNIDGVQVARATVRRLSQMDIQQVEVLKGPQVLFYGKNSPAGVISVLTADPTPTLQGRLSAGYELEAHELRTEGFVSGPLTDTLGARFAFYGSTMRGYSESIVPDGAPLAPAHDYAPRDREYAGRVTLRWEPDDRFNARLKLSYDHLRGSGILSNFQLVDCTLGAPQPLSFPSADECRANDRQSVGEIPASFAARDARFADGSYLRMHQLLGGLELNGQVLDHLTLTSITGLYDTRFSSVGTFNGFYDPDTIGGAYFLFGVREVSQELRLTSDFDGPVNFTFGANYQHSRGDVTLLTYFNANSPTFIQGFQLRQTGDSYSGFGQLRWQITHTLEFSAGGRYSRESKQLPLAIVASAAAPLGVPVTPAFDKLNFNDFSPELTLAWRPTQNFTLFGSYRRGFLSGGFNTGSPSVTSPSVRYNPEIVKGFEVGTRGRFLDGALHANLAFYDYRVRGLQVNATVAGTLSELRNAGAVHLYGAEFDASYRTPVPGLSLHGAAAYNHARYTAYIASCYRGLAAPACDLRFNPTSGQISLSQDLAGTQLIRAPTWTGNAGVLYETPISANLKIGLSGDMSFSSSYFNDATSKPAGRQPNYQLFDANVRLSDRRDRWEIALIGRNLTNQFYISRTTDAPFTGTAPGGPAATSVVGDTLASVSRGRELWLRLSLRFGG